MKIIVHYLSFKGTTPEGQKLNKEISRLLDDLNTQMQNATLMQERSGVRRPATTFAGKMDQVHQWMNNPSSDPSGLGLLYDSSDSFSCAQDVKQAMLQALFLLP